MFFYLLCRRGNNHFDVHFRRIGPYFFLSKDGKDAVREGRNGRKDAYFPPESAYFSLINIMIKVLFPYWTLIWRVNNYVSRQGKVLLGEIKLQLLLYKIVPFVKSCDCCILVFAENHFSTVDIIETLFLRLRENQLIRAIKDKFSLHHWQDFRPKKYGNIEKQEEISSGFRRNTWRQ